MTMAAKVTQQDITDAGFRAEQFGVAPGGDVAWAEYVGRLLADAERWARHRFGEGYDAATLATPAGLELQAAEFCWVKSQLWTRRAAFIDSNAASSLEALAYRDRESYIKLGREAMDCAEEHLALAIDPATPVGTAVALAHAVSGPWAQPRRVCG